MHSFKKYLKTIKGKTLAESNKFKKDTARLAESFFYNREDLGDRVENVYSIKKSFSSDKNVGNVKSCSSKKITNKSSLGDKKVCSEDKIIRSDKSYLSKKISSNDIEIKKDKFGKPFIKNFDELYMSVSHSKNIFISVFSKEKIGVDIEIYNEKFLEVVNDFSLTNENDYLLKEEKKHQKIINRFFHKEEIEYFNEYVSNNKKHPLRKYKKFLEIWTKKEAVIKLDGKRNFKTLDSFSIFDKKYIFKRLSGFKGVGFVAFYAR